MMQLLASRNVSSLSPDASYHEYHVKRVTILRAICQGIVFAAPFAVAFALIRGPDGEWPYAYWALGVCVGLTVARCLNFSNYPARVVVRNKSTIEFFNYYNKSLYGGETAISTLYETIAVGKGGVMGEEMAVFMLNKEKIAERKARSSGVGCSDTICLQLQEIESFRSDFSLKETAPSIETV